MSKSSQIYNRIDEKIRELSRAKYAVLVGFTSAICAFIASTVIGEPDYIFSTTIGLTLAILHYISGSNQSK
ncbi:MAG: hypothetical protein ACI9LV_000234 [Candidatus Nanohaloarchaea archaeon]|jgi:hypothetical protein